MKKMEKCPIKRRLDRVPKPSPQDECNEGAKMQTSAWHALLPYLPDENKSYDFEKSASQVHITNFEPKMSEEDGTPWLDNMLSLIHI